MSARLPLLQLETGVTAVNLTCCLLVLISAVYAGYKSVKIRILVLSSMEPIPSEQIYRKRSDIDSESRLKFGDSLLSRRTLNYLVQSIGVLFTIELTGRVLGYLMLIALESGSNTRNFDLALRAVFVFDDGLRRVNLGIFLVIALDRIWCVRSIDLGTFRRRMIQSWVTLSRKRATMLGEWLRETNVGVLSQIPRNHQSTAIETGKTAESTVKSENDTTTAQGSRPFRETERLILLNSSQRIRDESSDENDDGDDFNHNTQKIHHYLQLRRQQQIHTLTQGELTFQRSKLIWTIVVTAVIILIVLFVSIGIVADYTANASFTKRLNQLGLTTLYCDLISMISFLAAMSLICWKFDCSVRRIALEGPFRLLHTSMRFNLLSFATMILAIIDLTVMFFGGYNTCLWYSSNRQACLSLRVIKAIVLSVTPLLYFFIVISWFSRVRVTHYYRCLPVRWLHMCLIGYDSDYLRVYPESHPYSAVSYARHRRSEWRSLTQLSPNNPFRRSLIRIPNPLNALRRLTVPRTSQENSAKRRPWMEMKVMDNRNEESVSMSVGSMAMVSNEDRLAPLSVSVALLKDSLKGGNGASASVGGSHVPTIASSLRSPLLGDYGAGLGEVLPLHAQVKIVSESKEMGDQQTSDQNGATMKENHADGDDDNSAGQSRPILPSKVYISCCICGRPSPRMSLCKECVNNIPLRKRLELGLNMVYDSSLIDIDMDEKREDTISFHTHRTLSDSISECSGIGLIMNAPDGFEDDLKLDESTDRSSQSSILGSVSSNVNETETFEEEESFEERESSYEDEKYEDELDPTEEYYRRLLLQRINQAKQDFYDERGYDWDERSMDSELGHDSDRAG